MTCNKIKSELIYEVNNRANFSLYERFDDKEEINEENDGNKELYLGIKETENKQWQGGYLSSPVVWDNFRKVLNTVTDNKGNGAKLFLPSLRIPQCYARIFSYKRR